MDFGKYVDGGSDGGAGQAPAGLAARAPGDHCFACLAPLSSSSSPPLFLLLPPLLSPIYLDPLSLPPLPSAGNTIQIKAPKKELSRKEKKAKAKANKARRERGEEVSDDDEDVSARLG